jgi:serine/threonine-protein kinase
VYSCRDPWENDLAAKVIKALGRPYEKVKACTEAELTKLVALRHPNITYVYDAFEYRDTFYIITERCFCPLLQLFSLQGFDGSKWLLPISRCLLQAVHYVHMNGVVHQDIHLGNVFTSIIKNEMPTDAMAIQFKLGDLGVAKLFSEVSTKNTRADWMLPPEVLDPVQFGTADHRVDIYHVGLLLLQFALSRPLAFTREEALAGQPRQLALTLPAPFGPALEKTLRRHVVHRTATAMQLWHDLHEPTQPLLPALNLTNPSSP